jgi:cyclophilin family peptidyl-prolyl cis-trans isomerase
VINRAGAGKQRAALAIIAVVVITVGTVFALRLATANGDTDGEPRVTATQPARLAQASLGTPIASAREGYTPEGCWADEARIEPDLEADSVFLFPQWESEPEMVIDENAAYTAVIATNKGEMTFELDTEAAPVTVNNFICLATNGFYDVTPFHRVIAGFMVQAGDPTGTGAGGPGYRFADELPGDELDYVKGTLAMANAGEDTQGSQFFIVHDQLGDDFPRNYTIFGQMIDGEGVLDDIADSAVVPSQQGEPSRPVEFLVITGVTILEGSGS